MWHWLQFLLVKLGNCGRLHATSHSCYISGYTGGRASLMGMIYSGLGSKWETILRRNTAFSSNQRKVLTRRSSRTSQMSASARSRQGSWGGWLASSLDGCCHCLLLLFSSSVTIVQSSQSFTQLGRSSTSLGNVCIIQIMFLGDSQDPNQGHVCQDTLGAEFALCGSDNWHFADGLSTVR